VANKLFTEAASDVRLGPSSCSVFLFLFWWW
jgi:hypothetical protein